MTYQRFEDLPVWQEAAKLYEQTDDFLENAPPRMRPSFRDQLERAVLSVSNNVAEGFERGTTNELLAFIYIARGSAGEVRSMLCLLLRRDWAKHLKSEISNLKSTAKAARASCVVGPTRSKIRKSKASVISMTASARNRIRSSAPQRFKNGCWKTCPPAIRCAGRRRKGNNLKSEISNLKFEIATCEPSFSHPLPLKADTGQLLKPGITSAP